MPKGCGGRAGSWIFLGIAAGRNVQLPAGRPWNPSLPQNPLQSPLLWEVEHKKQQIPGFQTPGKSLWMPKGSEPHGGKAGRINCKGLGSFASFQGGTEVHSWWEPSLFWGPERENKFTSSEKITSFSHKNQIHLHPDSAKLAEQVQTLKIFAISALNSGGKVPESFPTRKGRSKPQQGSEEPPGLSLRSPQGVPVELELQSR